MKTCDICQKTANLPQQPQRELRPIIPPPTVWNHVGMDLICNMPANTDGYYHILVLVCYLSKYVVARPLLCKSTKAVIKELKDIYLVYGVPKSIQHDQGKEFTSQVTSTYEVYQ